MLRLHNASDISCNSLFNFFQFRHQHLFYKTFFAFHIQRLFNSIPFEMFFIFFYSSRYLSLNNSYSCDNYSSYFRISASFSSYSLFSVSSIKNFLPCCCWIILYIIYIFIASFISLNHSIQNSSACLSFIIIFLVVAISVLNLFVIIIRWLSYKCSFL